MMTEISIDFRGFKKQALSTGDRQHRELQKNDRGLLGDLLSELYKYQFVLMYSSTS